MSEYGSDTTSTQATFIGNAHKDLVLKLDLQNLELPLITEAVDCWILSPLINILWEGYKSSWIQRVVE